MSPTGIAIAVFGCVFGGALVGIGLRALLPEHHLAPETKEVVRLSMGLVATMSALVLGLLVASAKGAYDTQSSEFTDLSSKVAMLDRMLAHYGPAADSTRAVLKSLVGATLERMDAAGPGTHDLESPGPAAERLFASIQGLRPATDEQREMRGHALDATLSIGQLRWTMYEQRITSFSRPLLFMVVGWLTIIFLSFGLYAKPNGTVTVALATAAASVSAAIFLILELYQPYSGLVRISLAPLQAVFQHLGQ
ncbi:MAG TPA: hypothetical protein VMT93_01350 [Gemmatimonadaceae bacterium]|nr:hypothetical protein [Gemmatimonadaceae bacterium]